MPRAPVSVRSTGRTIVETPWELVRYYERHVIRHEFDLDVCAEADNAKAPFWITTELDAFRTNWVRPMDAGPAFCWMNPPFGREIERWLIRAQHQVTIFGSTVVALLPVRPGAGWWVRQVHPYLSSQRIGFVHFIKGRVPFVGEKDPPAFDCIVLGILPIYGANIDSVKIDWKKKSHAKATEA